MTKRICLPVLLMPLLAACSGQQVADSQSAVKAYPEVASPQESGSKLKASEAADLLREHNRVRADVGVHPLQWSLKVARSAQRWADHLEKRCSLVHNPETGYGENLFMGTAGYFKPADAVQSWERERAHWKGGELSRKSARVSGHYTQMVWGSSRAVGCGVTQCGGQMILVCNYDPAGNMLGQEPY